MDNRLNRYEKGLRIPKYIQLKEAIRQSIEDGDLEPHARLASRNELMAAYGVSDTTVKKAINELANEGYLYLEQGKGTFVAERKRKPITIALVVPNLSLSYDNVPGDDVGARLTEAIQDEAMHFDASVLLYLAKDGKDTEKRNLQDILKRGVDGLILFYTGESENLENINAIRRSGVPIVFIDRCMNEIDIPSVTTDNYRGAFEATDLLVRRGLRNIYHITQKSELSSIVERKEGYLAALDHHGLQRNEILNLNACLLDAGSVMEESYAITKDLIYNADRPFAVFALNSAVMIGAWRALSDEGIPHDQFALACFDEAYIQIPDDVLIIKVLQPLDEIGRKSVRMVMEMISGTAADHCDIRLSPRLVVEGDDSSRMKR